MAWCAGLQRHTSALSAERQPPEQPEINAATNEPEASPSGQVPDSQAASQDRTETAKGADTENASEPAVPSQPALLSSGQSASGDSKAPAAVSTEASTLAVSKPNTTALCDTTAEGTLHPVQAGGSSSTTAPELAHVEMGDVLGTEPEQPGAGTPAHDRSAESTPKLAHVKTGTLPGILASRLLESQSSTPLSHRLSDTGSEDCDEVTTPPGRPQGNAGSRPGFAASAHGTPR